MQDFDLQQARDIDVPLLDRPGDIRRERSHLDVLIQPVTRMLTRCWMHVFHRLEVSGIEHLPAEPPYILVANHTSHLDTPTVLSVLPGKAWSSAYPLAAQDTFFTSRAKSLFASKLVNALPIRRGGSDRAAHQSLRDRLVQERAVLLIYPEGTRGDGNQVMPFQAGIGLLAAGLEVPVVPCRIRGCERALPKKALLPKPVRISLAIGPPITFADAPQNKASWKAIASTLHDAVDAL